MTLLSPAGSGPRREQTGMQAFKAIHLRKRGGISALQAQLSNREEVKKRKRLMKKRFGGSQILCRNYWTNISLNVLAGEARDLVRADV